jgi:hypothetical protein
MPERHISVSESLLLRSPTASQADGGALGEAVAKERGNTVGIRDQAMDIARAHGLKVTREVENYLGTPRVSSANASTISQVSAGAPKSRLEDQVLLPTITVQDGKNNAGPSQFNRNTKPLNVEALLLTPLVDDSKNTGHSNTRLNSLAKQTYNIGGDGGEDIKWGKFEQAIRRWELVTGTRAPAPTKPDGRGGSHRLSSEFTEWLMGLRKGWVTGAGLRRSDEIKACGNGVVPQQAEMALRILLDKNVI